MTVVAGHDEAECSGDHFLSRVTPVLVLLQMSLTGELTTKHGGHPTI